MPHLLIVCQMACQAVFQECWPTVFALTVRSVFGVIFLFILPLLWLPGLQANTTYPPPSGNSPYQFDSVAIPSDTYVVNDTDSSTLDYYMYRGDSGGYDITVPINIRRYVGNVNTLLEKRMIAETFNFYIPAFDVDASNSRVVDCDGDGVQDSLKPEVNEVYFNDEFVGVLKGANDIWTLNEFELDVQKLNFPMSPTGDVGHNTIGIKIDVANRNVVLSSGQAGCKVWATEVDWAAVQFAVTSPVVFVPGLSGRADSFVNSAYQVNLAANVGLPSEIISHTAFVPSLSACGRGMPSVVEHAMQMRQSIKAVAERYGTDSVNLIAHSKGGWDSRVFLIELAENPIPVRVGEMGGQPVLSDLIVTSMVTHGTPYEGTVIADMVVAYGGPLLFLFSDFCDLSTQVARQVNRTLGDLPKGITSLLIGADADQNYDGQIDDYEATGNQVGSSMANRFYQKLRDVDRIYVEFVPNPEDTFQTIPVVVEVPTNTPQLNDTMVSVESAVAMPGATVIAGKNFVGENGRNHGTVLDVQVQDLVINAGVFGPLNWRLR
ncbi:MAG: hypothetical protein BWK78_03920 [Thiotrichaceae bacterium IS1]|nr:MAG: hypothetical protein BWK78_03920 [Thiotrichaceae bacterium IS1]